MIDMNTEKVAAIGLLFSAIVILLIASSATAAGGRDAPVLTDLTGPFNTLVLEVEVESLAQWEKDRREMFADPQVKHLEMAAPIDHPKLGKTALVAQPFRMSKHPFRIRTAPPECGEHTTQVMKELGYTAAQIAELRKKIVI